MRIAQGARFSSGKNDEPAKEKWGDEIPASLMTRSD
jgi:hypothetical protein